MITGPISVVFSKKKKKKKKKKGETITDHPVQKYSSITSKEKGKSPPLTATDVDSGVK